MYLTYDIKSIQRVIFGVPKLKTIIGASGLIAAFDHEVQAFVRDGQLVFTGGGGGAFQLDNEAEAEMLRDRLLAKAREIGADLRIGMNESYSQAKQNDVLYPFCPDELDGEPCDMSGLWPVGENSAWKRDPKVHALIGRRKDEAKHDRLGKELLEDMEDTLPEPLLGRRLQFFKTIVTDPEDASDEVEADAGAAALGNRSRYAVVAMDGNDAGQLHLVAERFVRDENHPWTEDQRSEWLQRMSRALQRCTRQAFLFALSKVLAAWANSLTDAELKKCIYKDQGDEICVLPFRPIILGGDDVILLCHTEYALEFVQHMHEEFSRQTRQASQEAKPELLWLPDHDNLTISAGILYVKATFPLHMAIPYAESLLGSAKGTYRPEKPDEQTPAAIDWDSITDSLIDSPTDRRNRELRFLDSELGCEVRLTRRPYLLEPGERGPDIQDLIELKEKLRKRVSTSMQSKILPGLRDVWSQRVRFIASVAKNHEVLKEELWEGDESLGASWHPRDPKDAPIRMTSLPDALLLLEEDHRSSQTTLG